HALAVRDRRIRVRRPPDLPQRRGHLVGRRHVEQREVLTGEAGGGAVLVGGGRTNRERRGQWPDRLRNLRDRTLVLGGNGLDRGARERDARGDRQAVPHRVTQPDCLRSEYRSLVRLLERDDLFHVRT